MHKTSYDLQNTPIAVFRIVGMRSGLGKVIGVICDNQLFVMPTAPRRALLEVPIEALPFHGAKNGFSMADLDDPEFLAELACVTAAGVAPASEVRYGLTSV